MLKDATRLLVPVGLVVLLQLYDHPWSHGVFLVSWGWLMISGCTYVRGVRRRLRNAAGAPTTR